MNAEAELKPDDDPEFFDAEAEAAWAKKHHFPTKVLGWTLISGVILSFIGNFTGNHYDLGGFLFLIAGGSILGGSQGWLKFVTFVCCMATFLGFTDIIWTIARGEPFSGGRGNNSWISSDSSAFWKEVITPLGYFAAISTLGVACIRTRRIVYWTKKARIWTGVLVGIYAIPALASVPNWGNREDEIRVHFNEEISQFRTYLISRGAFSHSGAFRSLENAFSENPFILKASAKGSPNSSIQLYSRPNPSESETHTPITYTEYLKTTSGDWVQLEMKFLLPEN
ncbi:hypothetical protein [Haloferula sp.]|uniref:hypothetical protein n=1 Tax=Haloferula sp. TaxID=2497595 RepID=UPI00329E2514